MPHVIRTCSLVVVLLSASSSAATVEEATAALKQLPALGAIAAGQLIPDGTAFRVPLPDPNNALQIYLFQGSGASWHGAILPPANGPLSAEKVWPKLAADVFGDGRVFPAAAVVSSADSSVDVKNFPAALKNALKDFGEGGNLSLKAGTNGFLNVTPGRTGALSQVKSAIGFGDGSIRVTGQMGPEFASRLLKSAGASKDEPGPAQSWSIAAAFPSSTPSAFPENERGNFSVTFKSTTLSIAGQGDTLTISGAQKIDVRIGGEPTALDGSMAFSKVAGGWSIACQASAAAPKGLFGLDTKGVTIKRITLGGTLEVEKNDATKKSRIAGFGFSLGAVVKVGRADDLQGDFVVLFADGKLTELSLQLQALGEGGINLAELPGLSKLPGANDFAFYSLGVGVAPASREAFLFGDLKWLSKDIRAQAALLMGGKSSGTEVALFFKSKGLTLRKLSPQVPQQVDLIPLDEAMIAISSGKLQNVSKAMFPSPVRAMIESVAGATDGKVTFTDGLTVLTSFKPAGDMKQSMQLLGLGEEPMVIAGSIGGVFRGDPSVAFYADLGSIPLPKEKQPGFLRPRSLTPQFFIAGRDLMTTPTLDVGLDLSTGVLLGGDDLTFRLKTYASVSALGAGLKVTGMMEGQWNTPLGLANFAVADVTLGFGLSADSSLDLSMGGTLVFEQKRYKSAIGLTILAAGGAPKRFALFLEAPELSPQMQLRMAESFMRSAAEGPLAGAITDPQVKKNLEDSKKGPSLTERANKLLPLDLIRFKNVKLLFATPGATNPEIPELSGAGVGVKATVLLDNRDIGTGSSFITDAEGLRIKANVNDFSFGDVLSLKGVKLDVTVPQIGGAPPAFMLRGEGQVLTAYGSIDVLLNKDKARFAVELGWGAFGGASLSAETLGGTLLKPDDFAIDISCSLDVKKGYAKELAPAIDSLLADSNKAGGQALNDAKARRDSTKIDWETSKTNAAKDRKDATSAIRDAQKTLTRWDKKNDDVNDDIKSKKKKLNQAKKDVRPDLVISLGAELGALYTKRSGIRIAYAAAKESLKEVKKLTGAVPVDLYPEVVDARAEYDAAQAEVATLEAAQQTNRELSSLSKALKSGTPPLTIEKLELHGGHLRDASKGAMQTFAVKLRVALPNKRPFSLDAELEINLKDPTKVDFRPLAETLSQAITVASTGGEMEGLTVE